MTSDHDDHPLTLRDVLALRRTSLANERTLLAYIRTAFMFCVAGVTLIKLFADIPSIRITGWGLLPLAVLVALVGLNRFFVVWRSLTALGHSTERTG